MKSLESWERGLTRGALANDPQPNPEYFAEVAARERRSEQRAVEEAEAEAEIRRLNRLAAAYRRLAIAERELRIEQEAKAARCRKPPSSSYSASTDGRSVQRATNQEKGSTI